MEVEESGKSSRSGFLLRNQHHINVWNLVVGIVGIPITVISIFIGISECSSGSSNKAALGSAAAPAGGGSEAPARAIPATQIEAVPQPAASTANAGRTPPPSDVEDEAERSSDKPRIQQGACSQVFIGGNVSGSPSVSC
jgi:hypothetical protein